MGNDCCDYLCIYVIGVVFFPVFLLDCNAFFHVYYVQVCLFPHTSAGYPYNGLQYEKGNCGVSIMRSGGCVVFSMF